MYPVRDSKAQRFGGRGIALNSLDLGALEEGGWSAPRPGHFTPGKDTVVGLRAGLDVCEKSRPHRDLIPGPSSP
jgi:hypothetical protein